MRFLLCSLAVFLPVIAQDMPPSYVCGRAESSIYQFLCPNNDGVREHLLQQVRTLAAIPGLNGIQVDYMRLPDAELPHALWQKYGLNMSTPTPAFNYCHCSACQQKFNNAPPT